MAFNHWQDLGDRCSECESITNRSVCYIYSR